MRDVEYITPEALRMAATMAVGAPVRWESGGPVIGHVVSAVADCDGLRFEISVDTASLEDFEAKFVPNLSDGLHQCRSGTDCRKLAEGR